MKQLTFKGARVVPKNMGPLASSWTPAPGEGIRLSDAVAQRPRGFPKGEELDEVLEKLVERLDELQVALFAERKRALLVVLQGLDGSGKDGTIRKVFGPLGAHGGTTASFKAPVGAEREHDFLWRIHQAVPAFGTIGIFNRSHYEDVLAVRVRKLVPSSVWSRRFEQINQFEQMLSLNGVTVLKFFLHISRGEQRQRFLDRLDDPKKNWKFRLDDLQDTELWPAYVRAYQDVLAKCNTAWAPWHVVPADSKSVRNVIVAQTVVAALEHMDPRFPAITPTVIKSAKMRLR